jgi:hypothetical protein
MAQRFTKYSFQFLSVSFILLASYLMLPKASVADVYIRTLESNVAQVPDFPHRILGGGAMDISINEQKAKSLIVETDLPPREAIQTLYDNQSLGDPNIPESWTTKSLFGVMGTDEWAFYADLFRGRLYAKEEGGYVGGLSEKSDYPALAVSAFKNPESNKTIVNFLVFDGDADLREAFMNMSRFDLGFYSEETQWGDFKFQQYDKISADDLKLQLIRDAEELGLALETSNLDGRNIFLTFSGKKKTREIFIRDPEGGSLGVITQDRYLSKEG